MLAGKIRSQIDDIWNDFWSGGVANPLSVIEQITYLLFIKRLDELETLEEAKSKQLGRKMERRFFPPGKDERGCPYKDMRWSRLKGFEAREMFRIVDEHVFPFLRTLNGSTLISKHMRDARNGIPTPALLAKVVEKLDAVPMDDRDTKGDVYEYMLGKIASAGQNGQFRTPRHIIGLMVELVAPTPKDTICDPAAGTAGFLVAAGEYLRREYPKLLQDKEQRKHFHEKMFNGFDFDPTMLRIAAMNMVLHGVEEANITYRDSLSEDAAGDEGQYSIVLANPPFAGSLDYEQCAKNLQQVVKTKKTELLFLGLFLRLLKTGGRAAVIVPEGVLFGSTNGHKTIREELVERHKLEAVIKLPAGVFRPYTAVSTAILIFTKTGVGGTENVWFYDVQADGWSLDDSRQELLPQEMLGSTPSVPLTIEDAVKNNLPDVVARWNARNASELERPRTCPSFCVPKEEIAALGYELSINRYRPIREEVSIQADRSSVISNIRTAHTSGAKALHLFETEYSRFESVCKQSSVRTALGQVKLGKICTLINGKAFKPSDWSDAGTPIIRIQNLNDPKKGFNYWAGDISRQVPVASGDLLLAWSGTPGTSFGAHIWNGPAGILNQHIFLVKFDEAQIDKVWLRYAINSLLDNLIHLAHGGVGLKHVTRGMIDSQVISVPPLEQQKAFAQLVKSIDELAIAASNGLSSVDALRQLVGLQCFGISNHAVRSDLSSAAE